MRRWRKKPSARRRRESPSWRVPVKAARKHRLARRPIQAVYPVAKRAIARFATMVEGLWQDGRPHFPRCKRAVGSPRNCSGYGMRRFLSEISPQQIARLVLGGLIIVGGLYVLSAFFAPLGWAVVLAIATWPLYQRFQSALPPKGRRDGAPLLFTAAITLLFIVPI